MISLGSSHISQSTIFARCGSESCKKSYTKLLQWGRSFLQTYCGVESQKADWNHHKKICILKTTSENPKESKISPVKDLKQLFSDFSMIEKPMPIPGLRLIENFISDDLHNRFIIEMNKGIPQINDGHYDGYDFVDNKAFDKVFYELTKDVFSKLKLLNYFSEEKKPLKLACTLLGYEGDGFIKPHVDSPRLSGGTVVIVSSKSPVVLNFYSLKKTEKQHHKVFVPPKSMYSISGEARDKWSHAILKDEVTYNSEKFERGFRYAAVFTPPGPDYIGTELLDY